MKDTPTAARAQFGRLLSPVLVVFQSWLAASVGYLLLLLAAATMKRPRPRSAPVAATPTLAVLVPAHNEESGIAPAVEALVAQDYPPHRLKAIVIADNCTDATAEVAARSGALVWVRMAPDARGKGQALDWALAKLGEEAPEAEIVVVVDADCIASPNLCSVVAQELAQPGIVALQARYEVSNAQDSPTAALRAAGFALKHVIRSRGRERLGLSCGLFGSGMAFRTSILAEVGWPTSITEDTELHLRLVEHGYVVHFAERASVGSPMPTTNTAAVEQQLRWESGNAQLAGSWVLGLVGRGLRHGDVQLLAAAAELLVPSQSMLAVGSVGVGTVSVVLQRRTVAILAGVTLAAQAAYVTGGLLAAGAPVESFRALASSPSFIASRLRILARVALGRGAKTWVRTTR